MFKRMISTLGLVIIAGSASAAVQLNGFQPNALTQNALTANALSKNALVDNGVKYNGAIVNPSRQNGLRVISVELPKAN